MKRIKSVNGYTIYEATTQRDADNYNCEIGNYNIYISADIRDYGLTCSYPEWENEDSLAVCIARCAGSHYAVAAALADELSDSTVQDMDLTLEIERRLGSGEAINTIRQCYDRETGRLYSSIPEAINAGYDPYMDELSALDSDPYDVLGDSAEGFDPDGLLDEGDLEEEPKPERRSHASYYVTEDSDSVYITRSIGYPGDLTPDQYRKLFFHKLSELVAFNDLYDERLDEIVYDGEPCHYTGWQPGMVIEFASDITGEIVYSCCHPEWDH